MIRLIALASACLFATVHLPLSRPPVRSTFPLSGTPNFLAI